MEDFVFGTLATDELKLIHHRALRRGVQHAHAIDPRDPLPGQPVTLTAIIGPGLNAEWMACYYTLDGSQPSGSKGITQNGAVVFFEKQAAHWDTLVWGYLEEWRAVLPAQPEGTLVRYKIGAWAGDGAETFADWPEVQKTIELAASAFFKGQPLPDVRPGDARVGDTFAYSVDRLSPPDWARQAVIYQIFVDRFYPGQGKNWKTPVDLLGFYGGTLWGVAEKLDYIAELGINCIWLSPIFPSPTHHGYDATDLNRVEPRLGGDDALRELVAAAHGRGIRVLLDFVCNHISDQHPIFQEALHDKGSPYRGWFIFDESEIGYRGFFGVKSMPQVNLANPAARDWMIDAACFWLREFDVDGYRLDYALGPGPNFWVDFWTACKAEKPDCFCFGEIIDSPAVQQNYIGRLDGCLDFFAADALRRAYGFSLWEEEHLARFIERHSAYFPPDFVMPTFLDNHDMDRFLLIAGGDKDALKRAAAAQMKLPGPPIIYYGTEVGLNHTHSA
ncbi:MAG: alpha-amylase, partial [Anaerolineae bacterium]|nr:alpha-amylase [Anaerolineae bacterium]